MQVSSEWITVLYHTLGSPNIYSHPMMTKNIKLAPIYLLKRFLCFVHHHKELVSKFKIAAAQLFNAKGIFSLCFCCGAPEVRLK